MTAKPTIVKRENRRIVRAFRSFVLTIVASKRQRLLVLILTSNIVLLPTLLWYTVNTSSALEEVKRHTRTERIPPTEALPTRRFNPVYPDGSSVTSSWSAPVTMMIPDPMQQATQQLLTLVVLAQTRVLSLDAPCSVLLMLAAALVICVVLLVVRFVCRSERGTMRPPLAGRRPHRKRIKKNRRQHSTSNSSSTDTSSQASDVDPSGRTRRTYNATTGDSLSGVGSPTPTSDHVWVVDTIQSEWARQARGVPLADENVLLVQTRQDRTFALRQLADRYPINGSSPQLAREVVAQLRRDCQLAPNNYYRRRAVELINTGRDPSHSHYLTSRGWYWAYVTPPDVATPRGMRRTSSSPGSRGRSPASPSRNPKSRVRQTGKGRGKSLPRTPSPRPRVHRAAGRGRRGENPNEPVTVRNPSNGAGAQPDAGGLTTPLVTPAASSITLDSQETQSRLQELVQAWPGGSEEAPDPVDFPASYPPDLVSDPDGEVDLVQDVGVCPYYRTSSPSLD